jgi:outer membrane protein assembly factor BamB
MKSSKLATGVVLGCVLLLSANRALAQDWPQWRGPHRDGKVTGFKAPPTWPKELTQKWKVKVGEGVSTPALVGDKLYVLSREGRDEVVRCLDAATGNERWHEKYPQGPVTGPAARFPGPRSSPAVADGKVVTLGVSGTLSCFDADSGKLAWQKADFGKTHPSFFTACSPILVDGMCIVQLGSERSGAVVAYALADGDQKWKASVDGTSYSSPVLTSVDGKKMIVAITSGSVMGLDVTDGKPLWKTPFSAGYNACTPIVDGSTVIYSGGGRGARPATKAIRIEKNGDGFAAKELWSNPDNGVQFNTPVVKNGLVFGLSNSDIFFCINADSGKTAWTAPKGPNTRAPGPRAGAPPGGGGGRGGRRGRGGMMGGNAGYGSIVDAGAVLLALTPTMELIVFEPAEKKFQELARIKVATSPTFAYPVVSGNRLFVRDRDSVILWTVE